MEKMEECKQKVRNCSGEPIPTIYNETVVELKDSGLDLICEVPSLKTVKSGLYKHRNQSLGVKKVVYNNVAEVEVPLKFQSFLLADYNNGSGMRIMLFCSEEALNKMGQVTNFFGDGNFKVCPPPFLQIYSIHGDIGSTSNSTNIIPLIYAVMSHKTKEAYQILFEMIKSQIPLWMPLKFMTDFEDAAMKAIKIVFPSVILKGCLFHLRNCLWRKAKELKINKNRMLRRCISLCGNLALLPENYISEGWDYIKQEYCKLSEAEAFLKYFEKFWMRQSFVTVWCVWEERHRTNNSLEGWHHKLNNAFRRNNTNFTKLLNVLSMDAASYAVRINNCNFNTNGRNKDSILREELIFDSQMSLYMGEIKVGHFLEKIR